MATYKDAHHRSILKAISWRFVATTTTILIVFAFTQKVVLSAGVGAVQTVVNLILYYFHERIWGWIGIGQKKHPLFSLPVDKPLKDKDMQIIKEKLKELGCIDEDKDGRT